MNEGPFMPVPMPLPDGDASFDAVSAPMFLFLPPVDLSGIGAPEAGSESSVQIMHMRRVKHIR